MSMQILLMIYCKAQILICYKSHLCKYPCILDLINVFEISNTFDIMSLINYICTCYNGYIRNIRCI